MLNSCRFAVNKEQTLCRADLESQLPDGHPAAGVEVVVSAVLNDQAGGIPPAIYVLATGFRGDRQLCPL